MPSPGAQLLFARTEKNGRISYYFPDAKKVVVASGSGDRLVSLDKNKGTNGEKIHLTIKALTRPASKTAFYLLDSRYGSQAMIWWGAVSIP